MNRPILILDDEPHVREALEDILETVGIGAICARDATEGISAFKAHYQEIELVILDMKLPGRVDGADVLRRLQRMNPALKAIVSSGYDENEVARRFANYSGVHILRKPFNADEFLRVVNDVLDH